MSGDHTHWRWMEPADGYRSRLDGVQTVDEIALLVHGEQWSEADLFGDLIAKGGQS